MISTQILRYFPHFSGLEEDALGQIASISDKKEFDAGEELFTEGDRASHFCLLRAGQVNIVYRLGDGQTVVADTLGSGEAFGWSAFVEPHRLTASCVANTGGEYIRIEGESLRRMCDEHPTWGYRIARELCKLLRDRLSALRVRIAAAA
jgi:CRP-like cAMP-binding protein